MKEVFGFYLIITAINLVICAVTFDGTWIEKTIFWVSSQFVIALLTAGAYLIAG